MDRIDLAQDRGQWEPLENTVINFVLYKLLGNSSVDVQLATSR
jgi:hypothetical protein